jgi:hypothetical protein
VTSAKSNVTTRRSFPGGEGEGAWTDVPQDEQNRAPSGSAAPQDVQTSDSGVPHWAQNLAPAGLAEPQFVQALTEAESIAAGFDRTRFVIPRP